MDPGPTQVDRRTSQVNRVQPAADAVAGLQDHALDAGMAKGVGDGQPGDPRSHHHDAVDRPRHSARDIGSPVVVTLGAQPGTPLRSALTKASPTRDDVRHHHPAVRDQE